MSRSLIQLSVLLVLSGCASADFMRTGKEYPSRGKGCALEVLMTDPREEFEEVCVIQAKTSNSWFSSRDLKAMLPDIKEQACECGADAVVIKHAQSAQSSWAGMGGSLSGQSTSVGIKFKRTATKKRRN